MKAITYTRYGPPDVLRLSEVATPVPKASEVLIRVRAAAVNYGDLTARNFGNLSSREFNMPLLLWLPARFAFGFSTPKKPILGSELSGTVAAIGRSVTKFKVGDEVFAYTGMKMGANAEYLCLPESGTVGLKPNNMSFAEACAVPYGGIMALSLLKKADIRSGHKVLINGASGGIGSMALQLARYYRAEVTGVCGTPRLSFVKALGADHVVDYTKADFTQSGNRYDLIFDVLGRSSFSRCKASLTANGRYLLASFKTKQLLQMLRTSISGSKKVICAIAAEKPEYMVVLRDLAEAGVIRTVVDRTFPLEQAADAHRYVEAGQRTGAVVITIP
ncbi:NAD(P)-dependent alcohol dehydrogenase [candidate division KSB1 bacterium]|nr:NAD(P)-dependent alcohol dehydrogenase [candidate division KSB1 bacterium]